MDDKAVGLLEDINVKYLGRLGIWPEAKDKFSLINEKFST